MEIDSTINESFPKKFRLRKKDEFIKVYEGKNYFNCGKLSFYILENNLPYCRLGVSIPKKVGKSVVRNRIKRLIREGFRINHRFFKKGYDIVVNVRKNGSELTFKEISEIFQKLSEKL